MNKIILSLMLVALAGCSQQPPVKPQDPAEQAKRDEANRKFETWTYKEGSGRKWSP
jgi:uncharacterized lipoprotein